MEKIRRYKNCEIVNISLNGLEPITFEDLIKIRGGEELDASCNQELCEQYKQYFKTVEKKQII